MYHDINALLMQRSRGPRHNLMPRGGELGDGVVEHAGYSWVRTDHAVIAHYGDNEGAGLHGGEEGGAPGDGAAFWVLGPWLGGDECFGDGGEGTEVSAHGANHGGDVFLAFGRDGYIVVGEAGALYQN